MSSTAAGSNGLQSRSGGRLAAPRPTLEGARQRPGFGEGSITVLQRFGSALNLNLHFHALVLDGAFVPTRRGGVSFRRATPATTNIEALVAEIADRCEAWLATQGYGPEEDVAPEDDDTVGLLQAASLQGRPLTARRGRKVKRTQVLGGREHALPGRTAACAGYNLSAGTYVPAKDRGGLERLARYVLRPPLAKARLEQRADGTVVLGLKRAWSDGTTALELSAAELVEKLVAIIPPPRANQVIYRGVLAARSKLRGKVVPKPRQARSERKLVPEAAPRPRPDRAAWSSLLHRVFGVDGFACPTCRAPMVLRTVVVGPVSGKILGDLVRSSGVPHATGPP